MYPRLCLTVGILTRLASSEILLHTKLLDGVRHLIQTTRFNSVPRVKPEKDGADIAVSEDLGVTSEKEEADVKQKEPVEGVQTVEGEATTPEDEILSDPPRILRELQLSLSILTSSLLAAQDPEIKATLATPAPIRTSDALTSSLNTLNDYITTETHASVSSAYRAYGLAAAPVSASPDKPKTVSEAVTSLKTEIRVVKGEDIVISDKGARADDASFVTGALLNRRNFAVPRAEVGSY